MAAFLAAPAALYWWKFPDLTNLLSLVVSVSFFLGLIILVRPLVLILALAIPVLVMNLIDIVHLLAFGGLVSLGALESVFFVNPAEAVEFVASHALPVGGGVLLVVVFLGLAIARTRLDQYRFREKLLVAIVAVTIPSTVLAASLALAGSKRDVFLSTRLVEHLAASLGVNPLTHTLSGLATVLGERRELSELAAIRNRHVFGARLAPGRPRSTQR